MPPEIKQLRTLREAGIFIAELERKVQDLTNEVRSMKGLTTGTLITSTLGLLYLVASKALGA